VVLLAVVGTAAWVDSGRAPEKAPGTVTPSGSALPAAGTPSPSGGPAQAQSAPLPYPAQVLGLGYFELTLPVASNITGYAEEVKQPQLAGYANAAYFATLPDGSGVRFVAPAGGATTSGSEYPRSELREMANVGTKEASWSTTVGTHDLKLTESINHLPAMKPQLVFAQIHGQSDDLIEVEISGKGNHNRLYVNHNGKQYGSDLDDNYALGTKFSLEIYVTGGYVDVWYNGVRHVHQNLSDSGDYFKAGCYTQSNPSKGDAPTAYGEVDIYAIKVSHG